MNDLEIGKGIHVMLIDDDIFLQDMYSLKFVVKGFEVNCYLKPEEALESIRSGNIPDIILIDMIMPKLDGVAVLKEIRDNNLVPKATIVMLTNQSQAEDVEKAKQFNIDGYIIKAVAVPSEVVGQVLDIYKSKNSK